MKRGISAATRLGVVVAVAACAGRTAGTAPAGESAAPPTLAERAARADSVRHSWVQADVDFMVGMIHHHAQALVMSRMAPTHGASEPLRVLAARIINGQRDEIALMQQWLRDQGLPAPEPAAMDPHGEAAGHGQHGADHGEHGTDHAMHMPGMLTAEQMAELDAARGTEWDRLFLTYMIQHHQGALTMVEDLFDTYGAAQNDAVFKLASDIAADQSSEIDRMQSMLREIVFGS